MNSIMGGRIRRLAMAPHARCCVVQSKQERHSKELHGAKLEHISLRKKRK